jgi:Fe-S oxidoreductase
MSLQERRWNIEQCNRCHQCKIIPTVQSKAFSPMCPSIEYGQFHAYSGSGKLISAYALTEGRLPYTKETLESITACSMCGACDTACRASNADMVAPMDTLYELRAKLFEDGQTPPAHRAMLERIEKHGNPWGKPGESRTSWAKGLGLVDATRQPVDVLLHVGCGSAFDEAQWPGLVWLAQTFKRQGLSFGTLGAQEPHAGGLAYDLGHQALARRCADETLQRVRASGAHTVVTVDAESLAAFRNVYPRLGVRFDPVRLVHITEFLEETVVHTAEPSGASGTGAGNIVTYHDPCRLGRLSEPYEPWQGEWKNVMNGLRVAEPPTPARFGLGGVYDAPRRLLQSVPGTRLVEMERRREFSYCCGAGAGGQEAHPEFAEQAARHRLDEAAATGATTVVSSCASCVRHLGRVARQHRPALRVISLIDHLKNASA